MSFKGIHVLRYFCQKHTTPHQTREDADEAQKNCIMVDGSRLTDESISLLQQLNIKNIISGFSLKHQSTTTRKIQKQTDKPVGISFLSFSSPRSSKEIIFKPDTTLDASSIDTQKPGKCPENFYEAQDRFLPLFTYNHANKADLDGKIQELAQLT